jgi:hypothetical protein
VIGLDVPRTLNARADEVATAARGRVYQRRFLIARTAFVLSGFPPAPYAATTSCSA